MLHKTPVLTSHHVLAKVLLLALLINLTFPPQLAYAGAPAPVQPFQSSVETFVRVINLPTNDLVFNSQTQKLHATVPSSAGPIGNTITDIDPFAGTVGQSVFIGSEPNKLALSADSLVLYAGIDGAGAVRRFDVASHAAGLQFPLGAEPGFSSPSLASDLAVSPGNSNLLAVARTRTGTFPLSGSAVVFDNGVQRPATAGDVNSLAFAASDSTLYGTNSASFLQTFTIDSSGVTFSNTTPFLLGDIQFANGIVYGLSGQVVNPSTGTLLGTFANSG